MNKFTRIACRALLLCWLGAATLQPALAAEARVGAEAQSKTLHDNPLWAWLTSLTGTVTITADHIEDDGLAVDMPKAELRLGARNDSRDSDSDIEIRLAATKLELAGSGPAAAKTTLFSDTRLLPEWLRTLDRDIALSADFASVTLDGWQLHAIHSTARLNAKSIETSVRGDIESGSISFSLVHAFDDAQTIVKASGKQLPFAVFGAAANYVEGAAVDFAVDLTGSGISQRDFVSTANGTVIVDIGAGRINRIELGKLTENILSIALTSLLPVKNTASTTALECAALYLRFINGRAETDHGIFVRTTDITLAGKGYLDLPSESMDLIVTPRVRSSAALSPTRVERSLQISGPLREPRSSVVGGNLWQEGLSMGTSWAKRGINEAIDSVSGSGKKYGSPCASVVQPD